MAVWTHLLKSWTSDFYRFIQWLANVLSYGPYWKRSDHGLKIPSYFLQKLVQKWIDSHDAELQHKKADEEERLRLQNEAYQRSMRQHEEYMKQMEEQLRASEEDK